MTNWYDTLCDIEKEMFNALSNSKTSFRRRFEAAPDDAARVVLCLENGSIKRSLDKLMTCYRAFLDTTGENQKRSVNVDKHRLAGNEHYRAKEYLQAIDQYSQAIRHAPEVVSPKDRGGSSAVEELPLGYSNRSVVYFALHEYQFALDDIEAALAHGYAQYKASFDLLSRKCKCLARLGRLDEAKTVLEKFRADQNAKPDFLEQLDKLIKKSRAKPTGQVALDSIDCTTRFLQLKNYVPSEKLKNISKKVAIVIDEGSPNGRRLVAVEEIEAGEVLTVTSTYASVLKVDSQHCHHCCRKLFGNPNEIFRPLPCSNCSLVLYCSEVCRTTALNTYHRYECGFYGLLGSVISQDRLALRLLLMHPPEVILKAQSSLGTTDLEDPVNYTHIYQLMTGTGTKKEFHEMLTDIVITCIFTRVLQETGYFRQTPEQCTEAWAGAVLLRHMDQIFHNLKLSKNNISFTSPSGAIVTSAICVGICPIFALCNHCCAPNAKYDEIEKHFTGSGCIIATRAIAPGEEITISENTITADQILSLERRQDELQKRSKFKCTCARCKLESKDMPEGANFYFAIACTGCRGLISKDEHSGSFRCTSCELQVTDDEYKHRHSQAAQLDDDFMDLLFSGAKADEDYQTSGLAMASLRHILIKMERIFEQAKSLLHPTSYQLTNMCAPLAELYCSLNQPEKATDYTEEHIRLTGCCYGVNSLKMKEIIEGWAKMVEEMKMAPPVQWLGVGDSLAKMKKLYELVHRFKAIEVHEAKMKCSCLCG